MKNYLEILYIEKLLENNPLKIRRKEKIYAKLPSKEEVGKELINYWIDRNGRFQIEDKTIIESDLIIARHEEPIGEINEIPVYKEWLIPYDMWMRDYGIKPTEEFKPYNQKIINVVEITDELPTPNVSLRFTLGIGFPIAI